MSEFKHRRAFVQAAAPGTTGLALTPGAATAAKGKGSDRISVAA